MIYSMTGYGRTEFPLEDKNIIIEVKSLNGKQMDINCKLATMLRPYEHEVRKTIQHYLVRGSVECMITVSQAGASRAMQINSTLAKSYYNNILQLADDLELSKENILNTILNLPEVIAVDDKAMDEVQWNSIHDQLQQVLAELQNFRKVEGEMLYNDLKNNTEIILERLQAIDGIDGNRAIRIRERIQKALEDAVGVENIDQNRLEQELIYYIEKIDISEEKVRLTNHCTLFLDLLQQDNHQGIGKKLNFVLQEMGREINTLGSKANDAAIQKLVVDMKDALEKAKEQSLNVM